MAIRHEITKSGPADDDSDGHVDITVVFQTSHIADADTESIQKQARLFLSHRTLHEGYKNMTRMATLFVKNGQTVLLVHYQGVRGHEPKRMRLVEADYPSVVKHVSTILEIFDAPNAT